MLRFHPAVAGIVLIALLLGFHQYQIHHNPCYGVLRLHVVANSDSLRDQTVKLKVRDSILELMKTKFAGVDNVAEASRIAEMNLQDIQNAATATLAEYDQHYEAEASLGSFDFPTRFYGSQVFPSGNYTAVRVVLGNGAGQNWWCVLFPPLCLNNWDSKIFPESNIEVKLKIVELITH